LSDRPEEFHNMLDNISNYYQVKYSIQIYNIAFD
jgi:hypothetical protein